MSSSPPKYLFALSLFSSFIAFTMPASALPAVPTCTSDDVEIAFLPEEGPYNGMSQDKATLFFRNISNKDCTLPATPKIEFLDQAKQPLSIAHEKPEEYHFRRFPHKKQEIPYLLHAKGNQAQSNAYSVLFWISAPVYASGVCLKPQYIEVLLPNMKWQTPFKNTICGVKDTPWYQESRLKSGSNIEKIYISALKGEPENPIHLTKDEEVIEASSQGQSELPMP